MSGCATGIGATVPGAPAGSRQGSTRRRQGRAGAQQYIDGGPRQQPPYGGSVILVDLERVAASRPNRPLYADVSLTIATGDRIGVVGLNGCGKSTLLRVLAGAAEPEAGTVRRGRDVRVGFLDQDPTLPPGSARDAVGGGWQGEAILDRLGMSAMLDAEVATLSGGEAK